MVVGSQPLLLTFLNLIFADVTLADDDTNSILPDHVFDSIGCWLFGEVMVVIEMVVKYSNP